MDAYGTDRPVGTLEELREQGMDPTKFGSCSQRSPQNKGCPWFKFCRFRDHRDQVGGKRGPANFGVRIILSQIEGSAADEKIMPCFDYYYSGLYQRQRQSAETGEVIKILAMEGEPRLIKSRKTVRSHPKPVPGCLSCAEGKCYLREDAFDEVPVPPFERAGKVYALHGEAARMREEMMFEEDHDRERAALAKQMEGMGGRPTSKPA